MRIQYCSDLHLEFAQNNKYLQKKPLETNGDILILAGDIVPLHEVNFSHPFFSLIADNYDKVFWVPGNHEYYHRDLCEFGSSFDIQVRSNIHLTNNVVVQQENIRFVFSTLWTKLSAENEKIIEQSVSDFACIQKKDKKLKASDYNKLHTESLDFIKRTLTDEVEKTIMVTHHLPSHLCNYPPHAKSPINEAFCVELISFVEKCNAKFWIYGHSHFNQKPLYIGKTMLLTNQLGYVHCNEHLGFKRHAYFSI